MEFVRFYKQAFFLGLKVALKASTKNYSTNQLMSKKWLKGSMSVYHTSFALFVYPSPLQKLCLRAYLMFLDDFLQYAVWWDLIARSYDKSNSRESLLSAAHCNNNTLKQGVFANKITKNLDNAI